MYLKLSVVTLIFCNCQIKQMTINRTAHLFYAFIFEMLRLKLKRITMLTLVTVLISFIRQ